MQLTYTDTRDMQGQFKDFLLSKAPDGVDWDLIISANESRRTTAIKGEFFKYFDDHLRRGAAVIIETWNLDSFYREQATHDLLIHCGVEYHGDQFDMRFQSQVYYPLVNHPVRDTPNPVSLTRVNDYWNAKGDLGDLLMISQGGDAILIFGRHPDIVDRYGALTVCIGGRLIIQTFSTHQYFRDDIILLWQNYIYNALKNRFTH
jgi:hypothetical protein